MISLKKYTSGHYEKISGYSYFVPTKINDEWIWEMPEINLLLEKAARKLGELNSFARLVPNIDLFIHMHVIKEAVISSRIEGTQTNIDEAVLPEEEINREKKDDWLEVRNYTRAMNEAISELENLPISSRLIRQTHKTLLTGVRGKHKMPGAYRTSQNWVGGHSIADAIYIPPAPHLINELMGDLEKFMNNESISVPHLIRIAIAHYQFETIHPFLDGNGRIGRLLITLYLVDKKLMDKPLLYLSHYFEKNKGLYYDNLQRVREKNDMLQWIKYFLVGIEQTSNMAVETLSKVIKLKEDLENNVNNRFGRRSHLAINVLRRLFQNPVISVKQVEEENKVTFSTANKLIKDFDKQGILKEITGQERNRIFVFEPYLRIFRDDV